MIYCKIKNNMLLIGIIGIVFLFVMSILIPLLLPYKYYTQNLELSNIPPIMKVYMVSNREGIYLHKSVYPIVVYDNGKSLCRPECINIDKKNRQVEYSYNNKKLTLDYSDIKDFTNIDYEKFVLILNDNKLDNKHVRFIWNKVNFLGTDMLGRDILTRTFEGIKISLTVGIIASIVSLFIGVLYGSFSGFQGGKTDEFMMGIINIVNSIPLILIIILISTLVKPGLKSIIFTIGLVYWVGMARQVRAQVLTLRHREFILAEKVIGTSKFKIIFQHIIPNIKDTILVITMVNIQNAIFTESFLSFIGLGVSAPFASLGTIISDSINLLRFQPYQMIIPSIAMILILFLLDVIRGGLFSRKDLYGTEIDIKG